MPVPTSFADLDTVAANNSPPGTESAKGNVDNYLRAGFSFAKQNYNAIQSGGYVWCGTASGTANAVTLTPSPAITAYSAGQVFRFQALSTNTGATTAAISGLAAIAVQVNGAACAGGEIVAGQWYEAWLSTTSAMQIRACAAPNQVGAINFKRAIVAATATATPLWATANGNIQDWTGTPTITDFPAAPQAGAQREVYPAAGTIITNAGNISVQGAANYTVASGDCLTVTAITATTFYVSIKKKDGRAVVQYSLPTQTSNSGKALVTNGTAESWGYPAQLSTASGSAPSYAARAWVNFDGTGTVSIRNSGNVSSITDAGTGLYIVNFSTAMPSDTYAVVTGGTGTSDSASTNPVQGPAPYNFTTSAVSVVTGSDTIARADWVRVCIAVYI
jgi:hypothetical protein